MSQLPGTVFHVSWCETNMTIACAFAVTWSVVPTKMGHFSTRS
jgi:hypothetical protein